MMELEPTVKDQKLQTLLKRKQKADSLPPEVRNKYKNEYEKICNVINEKVAEQYLSKVINWIAQLDWGTPEQCTEFLDKYPEYWSILSSTNNIDKAFESKDWHKVKQAIVDYGKACLNTNKEFQEFKKTQSKRLK